MKFCKVKLDKRRMSKETFTLAELTSPDERLGAMIPADCVVLDIDSTDERARLFVDKLLRDRPNLFVTKTSKPGGFHIWFKTRDQIARCAGKMISMFGWKFDILTGENNFIVMPDNFESRYYFNGFDSLQALDAGWESYDQYITRAELNRLMPYMYSTGGHQTPLELSEGGRNAGLLEWLGYCAAQGIHPDVMHLHASVLSGITGLDEREILSTILSSLSKYVARDEMVQAVDEIPIFRGDTLLEIQQQLVVFLKKHKLFSYDEATGIYYCNVGEYKGQALPLNQFIDIMHLVFTKKIWYIKRDAMGIAVGASEVNMADRGILFKTIMPHITFNSRIDMYNSIPEWDGTERINSFMKDYYECDANPNFTWLFLTAIVGKIKEPDKCYCPYFFDFVGAKGVGKNLLVQRLVGKYWTFMKMGRSYDDLLVNIYSANALVAIDDETSLIGSGLKNLSYDEFKSFVTAPVDRFSRKFAQPEEHPRSFVIVRTSNNRRTGWALDERRQIIFESKLPKEGCRVKPKDLPDSYFQQLLAEAKVYYERHGIYELTEQDKAFVELQLIDSYDTEDMTYQDIYKYIEWCHNKIKTSPYEPTKTYVKQMTDAGTKYYISWGSYAEWCREKLCKPVPSRIFWNTVEAVAAKSVMVVRDSKTRLRLTGGVAVVMELDINKDPGADDFLPSAPEITLTHAVEKAPAPATAPVAMATRSSQVANELKATAEHNYHPQPDSYRIPEWLDKCPDAVREFFNRYRDDVKSMTPTAIDVNGLPVTYGIGGLHAAIKGYKGQKLLYIDVKSMYPTLMLEYGLLSRAVPDPDVYRGWLDERLRLKEAGDPRADELKLKINSVYGLMKAEWCTLYDPYMASSVAVYGQVALTLLITALQDVGCEIINANTDGLIIKPDGAWFSVVTRWQEQTRLTLEAREILELEQADVNNYRAVYSDGTVVRKGAKYKAKK